jgi:hypothetical protein
MTRADPVGEGLAAALIQLSGHAERIGGLDARESQHHEETATRLQDLAADLTELTHRTHNADITLGRHGAILDALSGLNGQVATLAERLTSLDTTDPNDDSDQYQPVPPPRWWRLAGPDRQTAIDRLSAWVEHIYQPGYGRIAAALPPCWQQHLTCLYTLDWLSELWSVLYLSPTRTPAVLAAQAEWQTRLLPAAAEQMAIDARGCQHLDNPRR